MEIWFISSVLGAIFAGFSNFFYKIAANRGYNAEVFSLYGGLSATILTGLIISFIDPSLFHLNIFTAIMLSAGMIASVAGIMKVYALRHIDSTIYFPLFKLLSPALAIVFGIILFGESFSFIEWLGILIGLTVPLLLITKTENRRQNNLKAGLILIALTALISAVAAAMNKLAIDSEVHVLSGMFYSALGVFVGTVFTIIYKKGIKSLLRHIHTDTSPKLFLYASFRALLINISFGLILYAYSQNGTLGIVQTVHSMYILIPIVLSIIFYNEHWNLQKAIAIVLSVLSLSLLG